MRVVSNNNNNGNAAVAAWSKQPATQRKTCGSERNVHRTDYLIHSIDRLPRGGTWTASPMTQSPPPKSNRSHQAHDTSLLLFSHWYPFVSSKPSSCIVIEKKTVLSGESSYRKHCLKSTPRFLQQHRQFSFSLRRQTHQ